MHADVWMIIFVHSLEGEARKWFRAPPPRSIDGIETLDNSFLRQWGDKKDFMYYMTEFGSLKRKEGESISDFSKRLNKMYFLQELNPPDGMGKSKERYLKLKAVRYCLIHRALYWKDPLGVFLRYPQES
jgi:hypothetical protein